MDMKDWLNRIFSGPKKAVAQAVDVAVAQAVSYEPGAATDGGTTRVAVTHALPDAQAFQAAEGQVALEWKVGDVVLNLYEVKQVHEGGGMGLVYRVHHRGWNTDLAVKSPRSNYFQTEMQKENFTRECETWISLGLHPHIVSCHYVRTLGGIPRVFAEYVEGGSLKEWVDSRTLYEGCPQEALKRILDVAIQMAWGLHYAHEQAVIHQDVKPGNVLMLADGTAKITDFGLAKARAAAGEPAVAGEGRSILVSAGGMTPAYCSPEQANKQPLSRKTDIWSWAVSVMEMFVGEVTWPSGTAAGGVLKEYLAEQSAIQNPQSAIPPMPEGLSELLQACFESDPARRPKDAHEIGRRLSEIHRSHLDESYARPETSAVELRADALNNEALSLLDLSKPEQALGVFEQALAAEPGHLESIYNRGLVLWRRGKLTDQALLAGLRDASALSEKSARGSYLVGLVHMERGDGHSALKASAVACAEGESSLDMKAALEQAKRLVRTSNTIQILKGHSSSVTSVAISPDNRWALSAGWDGYLRLWELPSGRCMRAFDGPSPVKRLAVSADCRWAPSASIDNILRLWEVATGRCVQTFGEHNRDVLSVALSADGRWAMSGTWMYRNMDTLRLWDVASARCARTFGGNTGDVVSVALSADGRWALSGSNLSTNIRLWEVDSGRCMRTIHVRGRRLNAVALSADGRWALAGGSRGTVRLWEVDVCHCISAPDATFRSRLVKIIRLLTGASHRRVRKFKGHTHYQDVTSVALSDDCRWALSGSVDHELRLWQIATGHCVRTFEGQNGSVRSVALSPDGHSALSGGDDN